MNRTDAIKAIVWYDQLIAAAKTEAAKLRADLYADAKAEFEEQGTAPTWRIPDLATVAAAVSHTAVYVSDEHAFTDWVAKRYPEQIETRVRPSFVSANEHWTQVSGDDVSVAKTGEVVPGLAVRHGGEFAGVSIRATAEAKEVFRALANHGLRELAASASPAVPVVIAELEAADADA
jgi:hypothetical protein